MLKLKLTDDIKLGMAEYYFRREQNHQWHNRQVIAQNSTLFSDWGLYLMTSTEPDPKPEFNKDALLDKVADIAAKLGWGTTSSSGTFWFTRKNKRGTVRYTFQCNERNWLDGGVLTRDRILKKVA